MPFVETVVIQPLTGEVYEDNAWYTQHSMVNISWTGTVGYDAWVFLEGELYEGPIDFEDVTDRSLDIPFDFTYNHALTVIEEPQGDTVESPDYPPEARPTIYWAPVDGTDAYRIYHAQGDGAEGILQELTHDPVEYDYYAWKPKYDLETEEGIWHHFRVETTNYTEGTESTSDGFSLFLHGYPTVPSDVQVSGGSGLFTFTIVK